MLVQKKANCPELADPPAGAIEGMAALNVRPDSPVVLHEGSQVMSKRKNDENVSAQIPVVLLPIK